MATQSEQERAYIEQIRTLRSLIQQALDKRISKEHNMQKAAALEQFMKNVQEIRKVLNAEKRIELYQKIIEEMLEMPHKHVSGYTTKRTGDFSFTPEEKRRIREVIPKLQEIQSNLNQFDQRNAANDTKSHGPQKQVQGNIVTDRVNNEAIDKLLGNTIRFLNTLEKEYTNKQNPIKSVYKKAKKEVLAKFDVKHQSKIEQVKQLRSELNNIANMANNTPSEERLAVLKRTINKFEKLEKERPTLTDKKNLFASSLTKLQERISTIENQQKKDKQKSSPQA